MKPSNEGKSFTPQPVERVIVKHYTSQTLKIARCQQCPWAQTKPTIAEARVHVRHHPTHSVIITQASSTLVAAENENGHLLTEDRHA